jgi:AraC-like DNA-binding protein
MSAYPLVLVQLLVVALCGAGGVMLLRRATSSSCALGVLLLLLACHIGVLACQELRLIGWHVTLAHLAGLAYGPLFVGFLRGLLFRRTKSRLYWLPHAVPTLVFLVAFLADALSGTALALGVFASLGTYLALALIDVLRYRTVIERIHSNVPHVPLTWLTFAVVGLTIVYGLDVGTFMASRAGTAVSSRLLQVLLFVTLLIYVAGFVVAALRFPRLFVAITVQDMNTVDASRENGLGPGAAPHEPRASGGPGGVDAAPAFNAAGQGNTTGLSGPAVRRGTTPQDASEAGAGVASTEAANTLDSIESFMTQHRPFLRSELTLAELALQFGLPARRLSQLVNQGRGRNFADWVNRYRIEEAKRLLANPTSGIRSVLDAMYAAGFSSKSSFNALFKASTGITPTEFMRARRSETRAEE